MASITDIAKEIKKIEYPYQFSICTIVSKRDQYETMLASFLNAGFTKDKCEFLYVDNTQQNQFDAFRAFNLFLQEAKGKYIIICHQDVEIIYDTISELRQKITVVEQIDSRWGLIGNAGAINLKYKTQCITHGIPPYYDKRGKNFPQEVQTLDENFILVRKEANLVVSSDLNGFHLYGTDICILARVLGYKAYVIDFHLYHKSRGNVDESFFKLKKELQKKYEKAFKGRFIQSITVAKFYISGSRFMNLILNNSIARTFARQIIKIKMRIRMNA
ncbi:MAG TPA: hypothetical protein VIH57_14310 [Bacteroidales bacterium]